MNTTTLHDPAVDPSSEIRPAKLAHIVLRSGERYEETAEWYRHALNARYVHKDDSIAFMTYDDEHHRIAIARVPGIVDRPSGSVGMDHVAFTFSTLSDLLLNYERLKGTDILPVLSINHGATTSIYYQDPDRNRVEFQVDNFADFEESLAFVQSGVMERNPIGIAFDPSQMLNELRDGVSAAELQRYREGPLDLKVMDRLMEN